MSTTITNSEFIDTVDSSDAFVITDTAVTVTLPSYGWNSTIDELLERIEILEKTVKQLLIDKTIEESDDTKLK